MSEALKVPIAEVKAWLEKETSSVLTPLHVKAQKLLNEMDKTFKDLVEASKMLLENSRKEIENRNMKTFGRAKALNKLAKLFIERFQGINIPEKPSYGEFEEFAKKAREAFTFTDIDVRNWFPRISPFFIMDRGKFLRVFEKAKVTLKELDDFLTKEYVKVKLLEETLKLIAVLHDIKSKLTALDNNMKKLCNEKAIVEKEKAETTQKIETLKSRGELSQLEEVSLDLEKLRKEVEHSLRYLQKPFAKLYSLALHGEESGLTPEEVKKLKQYLEDPFEAFSTEDVGYPILKQISAKMSALISDGRLKLKPDKERKAKQSTEEILKGNFLANLYEQCSTAKLRKIQLSASTSLIETKMELSTLRELVESLGRKCGAFESEINQLEKNYDETLANLENQKNQIEKNIFDLTGKTVKLE